MTSSWLAPDMFAPKDHRAWPFGNLPPGVFDFIMADPPWHFLTWSAAGEAKSPQAHYNTMTLEDIAALPVADLAKADCRLWLWATTPLLPQQIAILESWGFAYSTHAVWAKRTVRGKRAFGTGYGGFRGEHEIILVGTRGAPGEPAYRSVRSIIEGQLREHSRKPDEAYAAAERMYPSARKASLFERPIRPGWEGWGDQYGLPITSKKDTAPETVVAGQADLFAEAAQ